MDKFITTYDKCSKTLIIYSCCEGKFSWKLIIQNLSLDDTYDKLINFKDGIHNNLTLGNIIFTREKDMSIVCKKINNDEIFLYLEQTNIEYIINKLIYISKKI